MQYVNIFSSLANLIESIIVQGGYFILFVTTLFEGIPVIGMVVPGHVAIMAGGFMAKLGNLDLVLVLIISIMGALIGDYVGFYIGKRFGMNFINKLRPYLFVSEANIDKANKLLSKHTGKALIIGRFIPTTRALMPFLVGTSSLTYGRFWFFNIIGGLLWVISTVMTGYLFGATYHLVSGYIGRILFVCVILSFIFIWGYRFINARFHIFRRYELFTLIICIISLWIFAAVLDRIIDGSFNLDFDIGINILSQSLVNSYGFIVGIAHAVSLVGNAYIMIVLGLLVGTYFLFKKQWRSAGITILSTTLTALTSGYLKVLFMSPRPPNTFLALTDPSFPSSHSSMSAALLFVFIYLFSPRISSWIRREIFIVICISMILAIGLSRLILNVHWFSDIIAGWSLGIFVATSSILFVKYISQLLIKKN